MPGRLPLELIAPPKRYLRDLQVGQECYVNFTAMSVDAHGLAFLDPSDYMMGQSNFSTIAVRRDSAGYHVTVEHRPGYPKLEFMRKPKHSFWSVQRWIPVESFTEVEQEQAP